MNRGFFYTIKSTAICLILLLLLAACPEAEEDRSISKITIYNIPANIQVFGAVDGITNPAYKIYLNASNSMEPNDPPAAKGVALLSAGTRETNDKYTVTIQLQEPNPPEEKDPNFNTSSWTGTASYFSVMISLEDVSAHGVNAIWAQGSMNPLNKGMIRCDWNSLTNFRQGMLIENDPLEFAEKTMALYRDIVLKDNDITKPPEGE